MQLSKQEVKTKAAAAALGPDATANPGSPGESATGADRGRMARRKFVGWSMFGFLAACLAGTVKFFYPRARFEPRTRFTIGYPGDFGFGVSTKFQQSNRIWVVRDSSGIYVLFASCTHLGCTPDWNEAEGKFKCPCHGSGFDTEGINFEGPAPKPLLRVFVDTDAEGRLVVDRSRLYEQNEWKEPGAFLPEDKFHG